MSFNPGRVAIIEGLDGSGKSTLAQAAALELSEVHPTRPIGVTDSTGFYLFINGEVVSHEFGGIDKLSVDNGSSKVGTLARLGAFTLARKALDYRGRAQSDLLLSVRDSHRIAPATYATVYGGALAKLSTSRRLRLFDRTSYSPPADAVVSLQTSAEIAAASRSQVPGAVAFHESEERLTLIADELPRVLAVYGRLFGCPVEEVAALSPTTLAQTTRFLEPLVEVS